MNKVPLKDWMDALISAMNELAVTSLGYEEGTLISTESTLKEDFSGSYIALVGNQASLQIGVGATRAGCTQLARDLFALEPEDEDLSEQDEADALGELANVVAGGLKARMSESASQMQIGLPLLLHGRIEAPKHSEVSIAMIRWNAAEVRLILLRNTGGS